VKIKKITGLALLFPLNAIVTILLLIGCGDSGKTPMTKVPAGSEEARVTSPNGRLDAILIRDDGGGAAGGWEWYVYIVSKGAIVDESKAHPVFNAGTLTGEKLVWNQEHLLEIQYDVAYINQFKNIWGSAEINNAGTTGGSEYLVEIRLAPSHPDFSLLTPSGEFRPKK
jgi:hypothetical protein